MRINASRFMVTAAALLVAISVFLLWYDLSPTGILETLLDTVPAPSDRSSGASLHVTLRQAKHAFDDEDVVFIDARSSTEYAAGHIPGALSVPTSSFTSSIALKQLKRDQPVITYCSGEACLSSIVLAEMLIGVLGHMETRVFFAGWDAWKAAGYPIAMGNRP